MPARLSYPPARTADVVDDYHGTLVADPYRWLEDADAPEVRTWITAQNALTDAWLAEVADRSAIRARIEALTDHPRASPPWRRGRRWFQLRNSGLQDHDVLWTMGSPDGAGRVLLDPNALSSDGTVALTGLALNDDGARIAYATSAAGSDWMTWRVRDVDAGADLPDVVEWSKFSGAAWAPDGSGFYYGAYDAPEAGTAYEQANRDQRLCFHRLGTSQADDAVTFYRPDQPEWGYRPAVTDDGRFLVLSVSRGTDPRNRVYLADLDDEAGEVRPLLDDFDAAYELAGSDGQTLFFRTDLDAPFGRVIAVDVAEPSRDRWREVIPQSSDTLQRVQRVGDRLLAVYLRDAAHDLRWFALGGAQLGRIPLLGGSSVGAISGRSQDRRCFYSVEGYTRPAEVHGYDLDSAEVAALFVLDLDLPELETELGFVAHDGVRVPLWIVHRSDVTPNGDRPTWLYGYGGFQIPVTPLCRAEWLTWIERGGVLAVANLRGGGEYGQAWHDAGRLANKQHGFDDAIAVAEWLTGTGNWTRPERLAVHGRSNGGLLAGACLTQRPDLFGAAVPEVGVLDMLRFHRFTIGWAWTSDYGSSDDPEQFRWLHAYSPLHNLRPGTAYPATLVTTGDHDDRVVPSHSFKFAAALQAAQGGDAPVLARIDTSAGHGTGKPTRKLVDERADVVAFLVRVLGR